MSNAIKNASPHARQKYLPGAGADGRIAICLTGCGLRATGFLLGALRRLNQLGVLSKAATVSAVGGGAIVAGALARSWSSFTLNEAGTFVNLDDRVIVPLERFIQRGVRVGVLSLERLLPRNWSKVSLRDFNTADLLVADLDRQLYSGQLLRRIPQKPTFWFNAVNLATNGAWHYRADRVGEALLGFTSKHRLRLADAVAAAAIHPLEFPPLVHRFSPNGFEGSLLGPNADSLRERVQVMSGSINDSLALEPVWRSHSTVIVCDGGSLSVPAPNYRDWLGNRILRSLSISLASQAESQKRVFLLQLLGGTMQGAYIGLSAYHGNYGLAGSVGYPGEVVEEIRRLRTDLSSLSAEESMILANHGYTLADTAIKRYLPEVSGNKNCVLPFPEFVDRGRILGAIQSNDAIDIVGRHAA